jgi:general stress protein YciG
MDRDKQKVIASQGGRAAHQKGTAHEWTSEDAMLAGRKGGLTTARRRRELQEAAKITETTGADIMDPVTSTPVTNAA